MRSSNYKTQQNQNALVTAILAIADLAAKAKEYDISEYKFMFIKVVSEKEIEPSLKRYIVGVYNEYGSKEIEPSLKRYIVGLYNEYGPITDELIVFTDNEDFEWEMSNLIENITENLNNLILQKQEEDEIIEKINTLNLTDIQLKILKDIL
jgi:hypothetical protein